jgi:zinc D-Ala-D-Ala dipeptidase
MISLALLAVLIAAPTSTAAHDLVDVTKLHPKLALDIRYATPDNFFGKKVYEEARCLLRTPVANKLIAAQRWLDAHHPQLHLLLKDCYRPHPVQFVLWDAVKGTPKSAYVADPNSKVGSIHSYGAAVDLTLADASGKELDMGTEYDHLGPLAEPRLEKKYLAEGKLTKAQVENRHILRDAMRAGGFVTIPNEWWHFDDAAKPVVRAKYRRLEVPFSAVPR